jgi:hypothetical protein
MSPVSRRRCLRVVARTRSRDSRVEWIAVSIVLLVLAVFFVLMLAAEAGVWTWVIVTTALATAGLLAIGYFASRSRHPSAFDAPRRPAASSSPADGVYRVLVVADANLGSETVTVTEEIVAHAAGRRVEAFVIAPELRSRLAHWTGDDSQQGHAERHLGETLTGLEAAGVPASGMVGSDHPIQAADDALRMFPADELVLVTDAGRANWLEDDAISATRERYGIPVTHVQADTQP